MQIVAMILTIVVAIEHLYIMYLEMTQIPSDTAAKTFGVNKDEMNNKNIQTLFKNQGLYNGLIGIFLIYGLFFAINKAEITIIFLMFVVLVAIYGAITSNKQILLKQGAPAILALIFTILAITL